LYFVYKESLHVESEEGNNGKIKDENWIGKIYLAHVTMIEITFTKLLLSYTYDINNVEQVGVVNLQHGVVKSSKECSKDLRTFAKQR
jgi:hypothetical protein